MLLIRAAYLATTRSHTFHTRRGTKILASQSLVISSYNRNQFKDYVRYPGITLRTEPSGIYNCHGLTFASRRAEVPCSAVPTVLREDEYDPVEPADVLPGDIVVYYSDGDLEHSGVVLTRPRPPLNIPLVCSKWGCYSEVIHSLNNCPYDCGQVRYFRIRK
jgi:hypothetical protein